MADLHPDPTERAAAHLRRLVALWRREREAAQAHAIAERRDVPLKLRIREGVALRGLSVDDVGPLPGRRCRVQLSADPAEQLQGFQGSPGAPVRLWREDPEGPEAVLAVIHRRRGDRLDLAVDERDLDDLEAGGFRLDLDAPTTTFNRGDQALKACLDAPRQSALAQLRAVLYGGQAATFKRDPGRGPDLDPQLNGPQREAVQRALAADTVHLIHGPPGTGKTRTLVEVVRQWTARGNKILACAPSNGAVDHLVEGLLAAGLDPVRLGHPSRVSAGAEDCTLDARIDRSEVGALARQWQREAAQLQRQARARWDRGQRAESQAMRAQARNLFRDARQYMQRAEAGVLAGASVICTTITGAGHRQLDNLTFDYVALDEATQAPDPLLWVALARAPRVTLAGDPQQLPPTLIDPQVARSELGVTAFERLARADEGAVRMLVIQHRMHLDLMAFPSAQMYDGRLEAAPAVAEHTLAELGVAEDPLRPGPLIFIDTAGKGFTEAQKDPADPTVVNPGQGERTAAEIRRLLGRGLSPTDLAVITPYRGQVQWLREALAELVIEGLEIDSIDGFQGREREAVVVDLVRSNDEGALGFLTDVRRMNVALTRARRQLMVIGDSATLGQHAFYEAFMSRVEQSGAWISAWSDDAPPWGE